MKRSIIIINIIITLYLTHIFAQNRQIGHEKIPDTGIFDERNYVIQGISIRKNGIPIGWSNVYEYETESFKNISTKLEDFYIKVDEEKPKLTNYYKFPKPVISVNQFDFGRGMEHVKIVQPFIDHPPLGGLIYSLGVPKTVSRLDQIKPEQYRKVALYLAVLNSLLIFVLSIQIFKNPWIATLSTATYNSAPSFFFYVRYALLENVLSTISLIMINFLTLSILFNKKSYSKTAKILAIISGIFAGLSILAKEAGVSFLIAGIIILSRQKNYKKNLILFILFALIPLLGYLLWGNWIAGNFFWKLIIANSQREFLGSLNFINIFTHQWSDKLNLDGWWLWGFISALTTSFILKNKLKLELSLIPIISSFLIVLFFAGLSYPWYYFHLIPYLSITSGYILWKMVKYINTNIAVVFYLLPFSSSFYWGHQILKDYPNKIEYRISVIIISLLLLFNLLPRERIKFATKICQIILIFLVIFAIKWNYQSTLYINANWEKIIPPNFPKIQ